MKKLIALTFTVMLAGCWDSTAQSTEVVPVAISQEVQRPGEYLVVVESVYDGDTFRINLDGLPSELNPVKIRVRGVDSPERGSPRCAAEREGAERARMFTERQVGRSVIITNLEWDKYGGRIDADVLVGSSRANLAELLIRSGNARPYTGGQRQGWC